MAQTTTVLTEIIAFLLGRKYYANIINTKGTKKCEISSYIFLNKVDAQRHREAMEDNLSYKVVDTISFRSRKDYTKLTTFIG